MAITITIITKTFKMKFTSPLSIVLVVMLVVSNTVEAVPDCVLAATESYSSCSGIEGLFCKSDSDCQQVSGSTTAEEQQVAPAVPTAPEKKDDTTVSASNEVAAATSTFTSSILMTTTAVVVAAGTVMLL